MDSSFWGTVAAWVVAWVLIIAAVVFAAALALGWVVSRYWV